MLLQVAWKPSACLRIHCQHEMWWARTWLGGTKLLGRLPAPCYMAYPTCLTAPHPLGEASWTPHCCPCRPSTRVSSGGASISKACSAAQYKTKKESCDGTCSLLSSDLLFCFAILNVLDLLSDSNHSIAKAIQLSLQTCNRFSEVPVFTESAVDCPAHLLTTLLNNVCDTTRTCQEET